MLMTKEIPLNSALEVRPKSESSGLEVEAKLDFQYKYPTFNAPISANKVFLFKLTVEDYFKNYFELIRSKLLSLSLINSVAFFLGRPVF